MPDTVHHVMWYTVYDAKTGDLIASGTSEMCARRLGYKSANSFASASSHSRNGRRRARKYIFEKERTVSGKPFHSECQPCRQHRYAGRIPVRAGGDHRC